MNKGKEDSKKRKAPTHPEERSTSDLKKNKTDIKGKHPSKVSQVPNLEKDQNLRNSHTKVLKDPVPNSTNFLFQRTDKSSRILEEPHEQKPLHLKEKRPSKLPSLNQDPLFPSSQSMQSPRTPQRGIKIPEILTRVPEQRTHQNVGQNQPFQDQGDNQNQPHETRKRSQEDGETLFHDTSDEENNIDFEVEVDNDEGLTEEEQANEIINLILTGEIDKIYDVNFLRKPLANALFVKGVNLKTLTANKIQARFAESLNEKTQTLIFYPTDTTSEIFKLVLQENESLSLHLTSCKGIGKSFSLALLVYLLRLRKNTRVLYLHNADAYTKGPCLHLINEIEISFGQELKLLGKEINELRKINEHDDQTRVRMIESLMGEIDYTLKDQGFQYFRIFDQVNLIQNSIRNHQNPNNLSSKLFEVLQGSSHSECRFYFMLSATDDIVIDNPEESPVRQIPWKELSLQVESKFIKDRFHLNLENTQDKLLMKRVKGWCAQYFLMAHKLSRTFERRNEESSVAKFFRSTREEMKNDLEKFLKFDENSSGNEAKQKQIQKRKQNFVLAAQSIKNEDLYHGSTYSSELDKRYFIIEDSPQIKLKVLHPLILDVINELLCQDFELIDKMVKDFENIKPVLGFIFEKLVLRALANVKKNFELSLKPFDPKGQRDRKMLTEMPVHQIYSPFEYEINQEGLHCPTMFNFPQYDAFIKDRNVIQAIQIKLRFKSCHCVELCSISKVSNQNNVKNLTITREYVNQRLRKITQHQNAKLEIILIGLEQSDRDSSFQAIRNLYNNHKCDIQFFYLDAKTLLRRFHVKDETIQTLRKNCHYQF